MIKRNEYLSRLHSSYLFYEIAQRKQKFISENPGVDLVNLGIGDTTLPIPATVSEAMAEAAKKLGTPEGYSGYGPASGSEELRERISREIYRGRVDPDEIFISDGSKCDIGRLQTLFGPNAKIAVQDPTYPAYVDGSLIHGVCDISYMPCVPGNDFFPDLNQAKGSDLIYFCSPNNPTGNVASKQQLEALAAFAQKQQSIIIFDSAYSGFIQNSDLPRSIFEIPGAEKCAIETGSFSKLAGFTGVRLGWTVVPKELQYSDGSHVYPDWVRVVSTIFNGPSNVAQAGGLALLSPEGKKEAKSLISVYMAGARKLLHSLSGQGGEVYGGADCPYIWVRFPGQDSWKVFQNLLEECRIVTVPGAGFGPSGEGFVRFSAFAKPADIDRALINLTGLPSTVH
jgi:LL-diaminopimelate aminotransferase